MNDFAVFILTHGRADNVVTYDTLKKCGYTGKIFIVIDNEDKTANEYYKRFGKNNVVMFDKKAISDTFDEGDNFEDRRAIVYARNACFDIAKKKKITYFVQMDDDYTALSYMYDGDVFKQQNIKDINKVFEHFLSYYKSIDVKSIAFLQGGDLIGGGDNTGLKNSHYPFKKRKAMNSFFCSTLRPFKFVGRINEDVNTYTYYGNTGSIFMSIPLITLNQKTTQKNDGGMTELYLDSGTYVKTFYSVMYMPSAVKVSLMGETHKRIHHNVIWNNCVPKIIDEGNKKASQGG